MKNFTDRDIIMQSLKNLDCFLHFSALFFSLYSPPPPPPPITFCFVLVITDDDSCKDAQQQLAV